MFVHCVKWPKISTCFLLYYMTAPRLSQIVLKFGFQPLFTPNFDPKWPTRWFDHRTHLLANCGRLVRDSAMVTMESLWETTITVSISTISCLIWPPHPQNGGPKCTPWPISRCVLSPGEYDRRCLQAVWCAGCHCQLREVAFCQITLVLIYWLLYHSVVEVSIRCIAIVC